MFEKYTFDGRFQDLLLASIIKCPQKFICNAGTLSSAYFLGAERVATARALFAHFNKHGHFPSEATVGQVIFSAIARTNEEKSETEIMAYVKKLLEQEVDEVDYVVDQVVTFAKERAVYCAIQNALTYHSQGESPPGGYCKLFEEAMKVGLNTADQGYLLTREGGDTAKIISMVTSKKYGTNTGYSDLNKIWPFGWGPGWLISILAPPKRYKCLGKGTGILMFDGSVKAVEDILVGDLIMGDDSTPRKVLTCGRGRGPLFSIQQSSGKDFVCNDAHILCLSFPDGRIKEMTAKDYAVQKEWFHRQWQGYKTGIDFCESKIPLEPYFLGLWLGDGTSAKPDICVANQDVPVADYLHQYAARLGVRVTFGDGAGCRQFHFVKTPERNPVCSIPGCPEPHRAGGFCTKHYNEAHYGGFRAIENGQKHWANPVTNELKSLGVFENKHIPGVYKVNSRNTRLALLAGLIDSDGNFTKNRGFTLNLTNQRLAEDVCWLARSLGFLAQVKPCKTCIKSTGFVGLCWRITIMGDLSEVPVLLPRKRGVDSTKHKRSRYKIKATPIGDGDYYGFTIDGNNRFVLDDFTVTHNTAFCINLAMNIVENQDSPVFYYPCEISQELAAIRCLCNITGLSNDDLYQNKDAFLERALAAQREKMESSLLIKGYPSRTATIAGDIRAHARTNVQRLGVAPKAIIIDFAETVKPSSDMKRTSEHKAQGEIYLEARALGAEFNCPVILPDRCNRETVSRAVPSMTSFQGAFEKAGHVDVALGLCSDDNEYMANVIRYFVFLNRHGIANQQFRGKVDPKCMVMTIDEQIPWKPEDEEQNEEAQGRRRGRFRKRDKAPLAEIDKE